MESLLDEMCRLRAAYELARLLCEPVEPGERERCVRVLSRVLAREGSPSLLRELSEETRRAVLRRLEELAEALESGRLYSSQRSRAALRLRERAPAL